MSQIRKFVRNRGTDKATTARDQNLSTVHVDWEDISKANSRQKLTTAREEEFGWLRQLR